MGKIKNIMNSKNRIKNGIKNSSYGITLTSLIIYITIMFVVLAVIMRVSLYFTKNISDVADTSFETEFEKINMYMMQETGKSLNGVYKLSENQIIFADENVIKFIKEEGEEAGKIYYNDIKIWSQEKKKIRF